MELLGLGNGKLVGTTGTFSPTRKEGRTSGSSSVCPPLRLCVVVFVCWRVSGRACGMHRRDRAAPATKKVWVCLITLRPACRGFGTSEDTFRTECSKAFYPSLSREERVGSRISSPRRASLRAATAYVFTSAHEPMLRAGLAPRGERAYAMGRVLRGSVPRGPHERRQGCMRFPIHWAHNLLCAAQWCVVP